MSELGGEVHDLAGAQVEGAVRQPELDAAAQQLHEDRVEGGVIR
ncbi:hypothetical protein AB6N35_11055 [Dietzia cinnamea]|uniref:Uncharacterized protein n=1 Tax=Dietzia cinnamea TaxID=321318 RepID=A0ABV3YIR3_9ACTN